MRGRGLDVRGGGRSVRGRGRGDRGRGRGDRGRGRGTRTASRGARGGAYRMHRSRCPLHTRCPRVRLGQCRDHQDCHSGAGCRLLRSAGVCMEFMVNLSHTFCKIKAKEMWLLSSSRAFPSNGWYSNSKFQFQHQTHGPFAKIASKATTTQS